ncbi:peptidyl-prolyl cis-trans isomerase [candidate division KSB1 bacterium]|nr:peptidyl-prolyl cis-trans isomerase [candidate division KSB1 bacterium]MBL7094116.1 peptidyl-prolyl cis-trans isomerase [candidate division KSB1 bacterium]
MRRNHLVFLILIFFISSCTTPKVDEKKVIVSIGSSELTLDMLNKEIPAALQPIVTKDQINSYVQQWIDTELIYQNALKLGMDLGQDFRYELEKAKKELLVRKYLSRILDEDVDVAEDDIHKYYEENKENFLIGSDEIKVLHILVATKAEANVAHRRIADGEDFIEVAKEVSLDYADQKRIELDFFSRNDIVPELARRVFQYRKGSLTAPIQSGFGYHIFKILEKRTKGSYKELDEVESDIVNRLASNQKSQQYKNLLIDLRNKIRVKTNENILKDFYKDSTAAPVDLIYKQTQ